MRATESSSNTDTVLAEIAWLSAQNPQQEFHSLMHHYNVGSLRRCFDKLDGQKACGADHISKEKYKVNLSANLEDLIARMKRMAYRPGPVREVLIPKEGQAGATRALGISNFEDKLVQKRTQELLESIYEPTFLDCSYGFRPKRSCHDAIQALMDYLFKEEVEVVLDVDIANFFDSINHQVAQDIIGTKIKDFKFIRYLSRMFKAGVLSRGELRVSDEGVAQGSCCSPVIANIVAHYVIDQWMHEVVMPRMRGKVRLFRYADDMVMCCQYADDARRIKDVLGQRLNKYQLALNEEKTKLVDFSKRKSSQGIPQGSFEFLGFRFYLGKSRQGRTIPKLKTSSKRFCSKLKRVREWIKKVRNRSPLGTIWKVTCTKLRGHVQYYGVSFNSKRVSDFIYEATRIIFKWLNRRSQRKSFDWYKFSLFKQRYPLPKVIIVHKLF